MALVVKDRVKESSTTSGTGTLTLAGAVTGFQAFSAALSNGDTTYYAIAESSSGAWEVGLGTYTASGTTLARTTVLSSSNSGSAINLSGSGAEVFITQPADKAAYFDGSGNLFLNQDPTSALQSATKQYVDSIAAAGIHYHDPVRVEREGNLPATYNNGTAGVGATLTNSGTQAALVIDGITLNSADRVLVYEQTAPAQNGIYTVTNVGSGSTNWVLTRATDADSYGPSDPDSLGQGDAFFVQEGAAGAGETYVMNTEGAITFGTTAITFAQFSSAQIYSAGDGLTLTGVTFAAGAGTGVTVNANDIAIGQDVGTSADVTFNTVSADLTGNVTGAVTGNASTASALQTARNIALTGAVTGSTSFDGSGNVSITTTATSDPTITLGGDLSGSATLTNLGNATLTATINANSVALGTDTTGNYVAGITAGTAIDVSGSGSEGASPTINVDLSELSTSTTNGDGDYFVVVDTSNAQRKLTKGNINISGFNNDSGFTTNVGDITGVTAGNGLTGGGSSGTPTLNVGAGTGVTVAADTVSIGQAVGTGNSPSFAGLNINGNLNAVDNVYLASTLYHEGDTDTYMQFNAANTFRVVTGNSQRLVVNNNGVSVSNGTLDMNDNNIIDVEDIGLQDRLYHEGDTNTYLEFEPDEIRLVAGGSQEVTINTTGVRLGDTGNGYFQPVSGNYGSIQIDGGAHSGYEGYSIGGRVVFMHNNNTDSGIYNDVNNEWMVHCQLNGAVILYYNGSSKLQTTGSGVNISGNLYTTGSVAEDYDSLSGTSPTCNVDNGGAFSLTMSGNTTFTFSGADSGYSMGFILQLTGNGSTVTWPSSVDWAGGTAPDAPASGASNLYVFWTRDGGSNWHGVLSSAAYA